MDDGTDAHPNERRAEPKKLAQPENHQFLTGSTEEDEICRTVEGMDARPNEH
jgi:hypothetical protein